MTKNDKERQKKLDSFWGVLLTGLPVAAIGLAALSGSSTRSQPLSREQVNFASRRLTPKGAATQTKPARAGFYKSEKLPLSEPNQLYRYPFSRTSDSDESPRQLVEREIAFYQQRVALDTQGGLNLAMLAGAYLKMARATGEGSWYLLAEQAARRSLANLPFDNNGALLVLARIAEARHDFPTALSIAERVGLGNEDALSIKVTASLAMGKAEEAERSAEALVDRLPSLKTLTLRALTRSARGREEEALQDFHDALALEEPGEIGSSARTRTLLGRFYSQRGQLTQAEELYREALRLVPSYPLALVHLAELATRLGRYEEAEGYYNQVLAYSRDAATSFDHLVLRGMARLKSLQGDSKAAGEWYDQAEALLRDDATGHDSGGFGHRRELALLLLERGRSQDVAEAVALMRAEVGIRRDAQTLDTLAWALLRSGDAEGARAAIREALRSGIRDPKILYRAGAIEMALGNEALSHNYFEQAREIDPTFEEGGGMKDEG